MSVKKWGTRDSCEPENETDLPDGHHPEDETNPDYHGMLREVLPALEWISAKGIAAGPDLQEQARRAIIRFYIAQTRHPGLAKTRPLKRRKA